MAAVWRDMQPVAGTEVAVCYLVRKAQPRRTSNEQHPLCFVLVVPEIRRARLPERHDALDPHFRGSDQLLAHLATTRVRQIAEQIAGGSHSPAAASAPVMARRHPA